MKERRWGQKEILNLSELLSLLRQPQIPGNESSHLFREEDLGTEARIMNLAQERYIKIKIIETTQCNNWENRHLQSPDMSCQRCAQYPWFRHNSGEIETKSKDSPVTCSFAWLQQQQTSPWLPPAPSLLLLLLLIEVLWAHLWNNWCSIWYTANLLSISGLAGQLNLFLLHDSTDHKVQNKKCKSQRQSLPAGDAAVEQTCRGNETNPVRAPLGHSEKHFPSQAGWCSQHHHPLTSEERDIFNHKKDRNQRYPNPALADLCFLSWAIVMY